MELSPLSSLAPFLFQIVPKLNLHHLGAHLLLISCLIQTSMQAQSTLSIMFSTKSAKVFTHFKFCDHTREVLLSF